MPTTLYAADCPPLVDVCLPEFVATGPSPFEPARIVGDGVAMLRLRAQVQRLGPHFRTALVTGETGTGKELAARELHRSSPQADGPFVVFHAASVGEAVMEWQGAAEALPTGVDDVDSLLRAARGGTLYFDQIGEMPAAMQTQLLHVLQHRERVSRGSRSMQGGETRVIASTSEDLRGLVSSGRFREDLYYRIATVKIGLPPLRERSEDVPALAQYFLLRYGAVYAQDSREIAAEALGLLMQHEWRGNVRELENLVRRGVMESADSVMDAQQVTALLGAGGTETAAGLAGRTVRLQEVIEHHVQHVLKRCGGNKVRAAELLGISRSTLYRMLDACALTKVSGTLG